MAKKDKKNKQAITTIRFRNSEPMLGSGLGSFTNIRGSGSNDSIHGLLRGDASGEDAGVEKQIKPILKVHETDAQLADVTGNFYLYAMTLKTKLYLNLLLEHTDGNQWLSKAETFEEEDEPILERKGKDSIVFKKELTEKKSILKKKKSKEK